MSAVQTFERPALAPDLPRDEMAFRAGYQDLLLDQAITTVFRPGVRIHPHWRGYILGETVTARVIQRCGCDELGVAPEFSAVRVPIRITSLTVKPVESLRPADFEGSSPDVVDVDGLLAHLFDIYGKPLAAFGGRVTRIGFSYDAGAPAPGRYLRSVTRMRGL